MKREGELGRSTLCSTPVPTPHLIHLSPSHVTPLTSLYLSSIILQLYPPHPCSRWASKGLSFLAMAVTPRQVATVSPQKFEDLKRLMTDCINHVIGGATHTQQLSKSEGEESQQTSTYHTAHQHTITSTLSPSTLSPSTLSPSTLSPI